MQVTAICLTADRQAYTERAIRCFLRQTYRSARLLVYDSGRVPFVVPTAADASCACLRARAWVSHEDGGATIGQLRNAANAIAYSQGGIFLHWDSDDWHSPVRIERQVEQLLKNRHLGAVGYREALFYNRAQRDAWIYRNEVEKYCIGASLCYWSSCWERQPFEHTNKGEDSRWLRGVASQGFTGFEWGFDPLLIAELHAGNTSSHEAFAQPNGGNVFVRAKAWDQAVRVLMEES